MARFNAFIDFHQNYFKKYKVRIYIVSATTIPKDYRHWRRIWSVSKIANNFFASPYVNNQKVQRFSMTRGNLVPTSRIFQINALRRIIFIFISLYFFELREEERERGKGREAGESRLDKSTLHSP